jgi:hypothetical protein
MTVHLPGSAEAASNRVVPPEMLPENYFLRDGLKKKNLLWAAEKEKDKNPNTYLDLKQFKALMSIELRMFVSYPASVFFPMEIYLQPRYCLRRDKDDL